MRKVLVLSSANRQAETPETRLHSYRWDSIPNDLNLADYDEAVLDLTPLEDDAGEPVEIHTEGLPSALDFQRLLFSEGRVIAIGHPGVRLGPETTAQWWLPVTLTFEAGSGDQVREVNEGLTWWFDHHKRFDWYFTGTPDIRVVDARAFEAREVNVLAQTRWRAPLGLQFKAALAYTAPQRGPSTGWITWLPRPSALTGPEALALLLRQIYGVEMEAEQPAWVHAYRLPLASEAVTDRDARLADVVRAREALAAAEEQVRFEERFSPLLFARDDALEQVVRAALAELGATVSEPAQPGIEDGRLTDPAGRDGLLEIKARSGPLKVDDVRQVVDWMSRAGAELAEGYAGKGIIVANTGLAQESARRSNPVAPQAMKLAERQDVCILTTPQLYEALRQHQLGELDKDRFWNSIMTTAGASELPELPLLAEPVLGE